MKPLRTARYVIIFSLLAALILAPSGISAQDDDADTSGTADDGSGSSEIVFEGFEDSSLFVGHYRLNPGDTINVELITTITQTYTCMVDDEGYITLPILGRVDVTDLTVTETREVLQEITDEYYLNAWITCKVVQLGKVKFYVYGDVESPGFYTAGGATTFFDFLQVFGLASRTDHRRIVHVRGERQTALPEPTEFESDPVEPTNELIELSLNFFSAGDLDSIEPDVTIVDPLDFTIEGEIDQRNFYLEYGDIIYVPDPEVLTHMDGFRRPGFYEVLPGETWADLIRLAGQPVLTRDISNLLLERYDEDGNLSQIYYNLNYLDDEDLAAVPLENRDRLRLLQNERNIFILGEVNDAGAYPYNPTHTPLDYLTLAGGATENAHLRFAVIVRPSRDPDAPLEDSELFGVDLVETLLEGTPSTYVAIEPGDILFVPDKGDDFNFNNALTSLGVLINAVRLFD